MSEREECERDKRGERCCLDVVWPRGRLGGGRFPISSAVDDLRHDRAPKNSRVPFPGKRKEKREDFFLSRPRERILLFLLLPLERKKKKKKTPRRSSLWPRPPSAFFSFLVLPGRVLIGPRAESVAQSNKKKTASKNEKRGETK